MSAEDKDLTILNHDQQLAADLKAGKVTMDEVQRIWDLTSDLSAQAPINVRRAMIAIRAAETPEQKVHLAMQFMMSAATEIQAAMTRDESKFAHLVAGTEAIVKALQNVNPLAHRLERLETMVDGLGEMMERKFKEPAAKIQPELPEAYYRAVKGLPISVRAFNCLVQADIQYVGELVQKTEQDLLRIKYLGKHTLAEIKEILTEMGLRLGTRVVSLPSRAELLRRHQQTCGDSDGGHSWRDGVCVWCGLELKQYSPLASLTPRDRWTCLCGASFENEDDYDRHAMGCVSEPEEAIPDADAEPNAARAESIGSAWAKPADQGPLYLYECPNEECGFTYLSGIRTNPFEVEQFRCPAHNLVLNYAGEAQPEDRANFARQILKHT